MRTFIFIWGGQVVSLLGSGLTRFAVGVWVFQKTGSVTDFTVLVMIALVSELVLLPFSGVLADRWDRRRLMIWSDLGAALATGMIPLFLVLGRLEVWVVYLVVALISAASSLQTPAYTASVTMLIPKRHFARASGMMQFGHAGARILAPLLAGALIGLIGIRGVVTIDLGTFLLALLTLLAVRIPRPAPASAKEAEKPFLSQVTYGGSYILARPGLGALAGLFAVVNLLVGMSLVLVTPLVLSFAAPFDLGTVLSTGSAGALAGSLLMIVWGGPKNRVRGILVFSPALGLALLLIGTRASVLQISAGLFAFFFVVPVVNACERAIWQSKVEPAVQGRVLATRLLLSQGSAPVGCYLAGRLADDVFEPLLAAGGPLAATLGPWIGTGDGRGIGLLFILMGGVIFLTCVGGVLFAPLRRLEQELADAVGDEVPTPAETSPQR